MVDWNALFVYDYDIPLSGYLLHYICLVSGIFVGDVTYIFRPESSCSEF